MMEEGHSFRCIAAGRANSYFYRFKNLWEIGYRVENQIIKYDWIFVLFNLKSVGWVTFIYRRKIFNFIHCTKGFNLIFLHTANSWPFARYCGSGVGNADGHLWAFFEWIVGIGSSFHLRVDFVLPLEISFSSKCLSHKTLVLVGDQSIRFTNFRHFSRSSGLFSVGKWNVDMFSFSSTIASSFGHSLSYPVLQPYATHLFTIFHARQQQKLDQQPHQRPNVGLGTLCTKH